MKEINLVDYQEKKLVKDALNEYPKSRLPKNYKKEETWTLTKSIAVISEQSRESSSQSQESLGSPEEAENENTTSHPPSVNTTNISVPGSI